MSKIAKISDINQVVKVIGFSNTQVSVIQCSLIIEEIFQKLENIVG